MAEPFELFKAKIAEASDPNLRNLALPTVVRAMQVDQLDVMDGGSRPAAIVSIATEPTATDTVTIGGDVFEFVAAAGDTADPANIAVALTATVANTVDNLIAAINATNATNEHPTIFNGDGETPALANGTELVVADKVLGASKVRIRAAVAPGGALSTDLSAIPSITVSETFTDGTDAWDCGNVNINTLGAVASGQLQVGRAVATIAGVGAGKRRVFSFPFAVTHFMAQVRTAAGVVKYPVADAWAISGNDVVLTLNGGGAPEVVNTDIVSVIAFG